MKEWKRHAAIVLAAGKGSRMKCDVPKQYLSLKGKPVLYYALKAFEESFIDEIVLVTGVGQDTTGLKQAVAAERQELAGFKQEFLAVKQMLSNLETVASGIEQDVATIRQDIAKERKAMELMAQKTVQVEATLENVTNPRLQTVQDSQKEVQSRLDAFDLLDEKLEKVRSIVDVLRAIRINPQY